MATAAAQQTLLDESTKEPSATHEGGYLVPAEVWRCVLEALSEAATHEEIRKARQLAEEQARPVAGNLRELVRRACELAALCEHDEGLEEAEVHSLERITEAAGAIRKVALALHLPHAEGAAPAPLAEPQGKEQPETRTFPLTDELTVEVVHPSTGAAYIWVSTPRAVRAGPYVLDTEGGLEGLSSKVKPKDGLHASEQKAVERLFLHAPAARAAMAASSSSEAAVAWAQDVGYPSAGTKKSARKPRAKKAALPPTPEEPAAAKGAVCGKPHPTLVGVVCGESPHSKSMKHAANSTGAPPVIWREAEEEEDTSGAGPATRRREEERPGPSAPPSPSRTRAEPQEWTYTQVPATKGSKRGSFRIMRNLTSTVATLTYEEGNAEHQALAESDARLMTHAPELSDVLKEMVEMVKSTAGSNSDLGKLALRAVEVLERAGVPHG
jgi:hypothetical protein